MGIEFWFFVYFMFAGLFTIGYIPIEKGTPFWMQLILDGIYLLLGWIVFPTILGGALRVWISKK